MEEMEETKQLVRHVDRRVRFLTWLCVVLFVALVASLIRGEYVNDAAHDARRAAARAETAARKTDRRLSAAIEAQTNGNGPKPEQIGQAVQAIITALGPDGELHKVLILLQNHDAFDRNTGGN